MGVGRSPFTVENNLEINGEINGTGMTTIHACCFSNIRAFTIPSYSHGPMALAHSSSILQYASKSCMDAFKPKERLSVLLLPDILTTSAEGCLLELSRTEGTALV